MKTPAPAPAPAKPRKPRLGRPRIPQDAEFQIQLSAYVEALPGGIKQAAGIIHMTPKIVTYWLDGKGNPPYPTKIGTLALLAMSVTRPIAATQGD